MSGESPTVGEPTSVADFGDFKVAYFNDIFPFKFVTIHKVGGDGGVSVHTDVDTTLILVVGAIVHVCKQVFCIEVNACCNVKRCDVVVIEIDVVALFGCFRHCAKGDSPSCFARAVKGICDRHFLACAFVEDKGVACAVNDCAVFDKDVCGEFIFIDVNIVESEGVA